jgi:mannose-6-phosphate isomerase
MPYLSKMRTSTLPAIFKITGVHQHYSWGGTRFLPRFFGLENEGQKPFAEYWLGAHPNHPSSTPFGPLDGLLKENRQALMGTNRAAPFPFLLKLLDVRHMLSIQVHPDKASAEKGFEAEQEAGIPPTAPERSYKDANHKPELMAALSNFWLLHGFKPESSLRQVLGRYASFTPLLRQFDEGGYRRLFEYLMRLPQEEVNRMLEPVVFPLLTRYQNGELGREGEDFWAARAYLHFCTSGNFDRGICCIYLFNLLWLRPGEGIFQGAGLPHAYLEGQNVEIMANSDNVLRAGLTDKHIAIEELLKHVRFEATEPRIIAAGEGVDMDYPSPAEEFALSRHRVSGSRTFSTGSAEVWLVMEGPLRCCSGNTEERVEKGESLFLSAGQEVVVEGEGSLFRARVPVGAKI